MKHYKYCSILLITFLVPMAWAGEPISIDVGTDVFLKNGTIRELVYPATETDNAYYSALDWGVGNVVFLGTTLSVILLEKFALQGSLATNLNKGWGFMENRDWYDLENSNNTHYSKSDFKSR